MGVGQRQRTGSSGQVNRQRIAAASAMAQIIKCVSNTARQPLDFPNLSSSLNAENMQMAWDEISSWPGYTPTPLHHMPELAEHCGVKAVLYKDEAQRFGLGSFKALGGAYAVANLMKRHRLAGQDLPALTVTTATDGNHGRSVAWGAQRVGCAAKIFIHKHVSKSREQAMRDLGADVMRIDGNYDASLAVCRDEAESQGWQMVSDTSWPGYREIPLEVMAGYTVLARELIEQVGNLRISHAFLPVGVGGMAGGIVAALWQEMGKQLCHIISVESDRAPCFQLSIAAHSPTKFEIVAETLMAGLSCGEVSELAWEILQPTLSHCLSISDQAVAPLMRLLGRESFGGLSLQAGECSTAGLAALLAANKDSKLRRELSLGKDSVVLLIGTEGATDPELYESILKGHNTT